MALRTTTGFLPFVLVVVLAACDATRSPTPAAPSAVQQQPAPVPAAPTPMPAAPTPMPTPPGAFPPGVLSAYTLSGVVFEVTTSGQSPIEGVSVYCELCGAATHSWATTDSNGVYSF